MKTIYLYRQKYKIELIPSGVITDFKKLLVYQHGVDLQGNYIDLRGKYKTSQDVYVLMRSNIIETTKPTSEERKVLLHFLNASIKYIKILNLTEILVRSIADKKLLSYFYDDICIKEDKWNLRIQNLLSNQNDWEETESIPGARFDRHKYSIYQLAKDLKTYKAKICINKELLNYTNITMSSRFVRISSDVIFATVYDVIENSKKANLSLLVKSEEDEYYSTLCIIRDGKPYLKEFILKSENLCLRKKLYGSKIVRGSIISNNILYLKINNLPVISKRFLKIKEEEIVTSLVNVEIQKNCMRRIMPHPDPDEVKKDTDKIGKREAISDFRYCELMTKLHSSIPINSIEQELAKSTDYTVRKRELKKAKKKRNNLIFRYLLSKHIRSGMFTDIYKNIVSFKVHDRT